jgi:hypothetical protein
MAENPGDIIKYNVEVVKRIFDNKKNLRRKNTRLPVEEKIRILVRLQETALTLHPNRGGGDTRMVWKLS